MSVKLYPFQKQGVRALERLGGCAILADQPGLGKSVQSLVFAHRDRENRLPAAVVCPASVKYHWRNEAAMHLGMRAEILEGTKPPKQTRIGTPPPLVILNHDIIWPWLPYLQSLGLRTVILDEAHNFCNHRTLRSKGAKQLCKGVPNVLALTGTPLVNRPIEIWSILHLVRPEMYPSRFHFGLTFCGGKQTNFGWDFNGASNTARLNEELKAVMIRRLKEDVLHELPKKSRHVIMLPLANPEEYQRAERHFIAWMRETHGDAKAWRAARAQRVTQMGYLRRLASQGKLPAVMEWVDRFLAGCDDKLILFAVHRAMIAELRKRYAGTSVVVDGSVTGRDRQRAFSQFTKGRRTRLLIGNSQAAGTGWNGTAASDVALAEFDWRPGVNTQAEDRPHRIGAEADVRCHWLVAHGTIEHRLCKILQQKQQTITAVVDGGDGEDLPVLHLLEQEMLRAQGAFDFAA